MENLGVGKDLKVSPRNQGPVVSMLALLKSLFKPGQSNAHALHTPRLKEKQDYVQHKHKHILAAGSRAACTAYTMSLAMVTHAFRHQTPYVPRNDTVIMLSCDALIKNHAVRQRGGQSRALVSETIFFDGVSEIMS